MMIVINSKRPINIATDKIHLAIPGKAAKVLSGPIIVPNPGPTLDRAVNVPDKQVVRSNPVSANNNVISAVDKKKTPMKTMMPMNKSSLMGLSPYLGIKTP